MVRSGTGNRDNHSFVGIYLTGKKKSKGTIGIGTAVSEEKIDCETNIFPMTVLVTSPVIRYGYEETSDYTMAKRDGR